MRKPVTDEHWGCWNSPGNIDPRIGPQVVWSSCRLHHGKTKYKCILSNKICHGHSSPARDFLGTNYQYSQYFTVKASAIKTEEFSTKSQNTNIVAVSA